MRFRLYSLVLLAGIALAPLSAAQASGLKFDDIRNQQAEIRAGVMAKSGRYGDLSDNTRNELLLRQTRLLSLIEGKQAPDELNPEQRVAVFNELEWIEATVNRVPDERLICEYTRTIGSNRKQRVCRTADQMQEERERARETLGRPDVQMRRDG